ncbi:MAG TPA: PQQ-binding-like beta-propeller repeat protein [Prolixibacteraceae bacterium]|nr:PQQ-binding-like beta-propeller repeat protein [Prolixibacteraceae bacterium]
MKTTLKLFMVLFLFSLGVQAQNSTAWRGGTNGIYPDKGLMKTWPQSGPEILWTFQGLGLGHSSPVFAMGKIFVSTTIESTGYIFILSMDGKEIKRYAYGEEFIESWPGTRSTPVIDGDWLYIYSGYGVIYAFDAMNGTLRWKRDMLKEADGKNITWGVTETLVTDGDLIFCSPGGSQNNVVALNRLTGKTVWSSPGLGEVSAYCTPLLLDLKNRKLLVTMMASHILGIDASNGKLLWSWEQPNQWSVHANTPVYADGMLYCTSGYGKGTVALNLSADGSTISKAWFNEKLDSRMGGVVYLNGFLYGSGDKKSEWQCLDAKTGISKWESKEVGKGDIISADGLLFLYSEKGELAIAEANATAFKLLGFVKVDKGTAQHWAHPVINNGILYVRHGDALIAYKIK